MSKKNIAMALVLAVLILLCSCNMNNNYAKLSAEQKRADFLYLYQVLNEDYPLFGVKFRQYGVAWLENKDSYLQRISKTDNDKEFYLELTAVLQELKDGHTDLVPPFFYDYLKEMLPEAEGIAQPGRLDYLKNIIVDAEESYGYWGQVVKEFNARHAQSFARTTKGNLLSLGKYHDGATLYLQIKSFLMTDADCIRLKEFIVTNKNSTNIIIDIRDNSGGSDLQWLDNIVDPLLKEDVEVKRRIALRGGDLGEIYYNIMASLANGDDPDFRKPIAELPQGLSYPSELAEDFEYYIESANLYSAKDSIGFTGDIYLLVNDRVYSSAEGLASFCKQTGFATIVGERTRGDGGSFEPAMFRLPHSGLIVRMRLQLILNPDGTANAEYGTAPDIVVKADQALPETLKIIARKQ